MRVKHYGPTRRNLNYSTNRKIGLAVFWAFLLSACSNPTPPLARGLPKSLGPTPDLEDA
jgi:hypothetical protein